MLWNFYFDLIDDVKIQELAVNVYFGNNVVILLKTRIEYPFVYSLSHNEKNFSVPEILSFINEQQV